MVEDPSRAGSPRLSLQLVKRNSSWFLSAMLGWSFTPKETSRNLFLLIKKSVSIILLFVDSKSVRWGPPLVPVVQPGTAHSKGSSGGSSCFQQINPWISVHPFTDAEKFWAFLLPPDSQQDDPSSFSVSKFKQRKRQLWHGVKAKNPCEGVHRTSLAQTQGDKGVTQGQKHQLCSSFQWKLAQQWHQIPSASIPSWICRQQENRSGWNSAQWRNFCWAAPSPPWNVHLWNPWNQQALKVENWSFFFICLQPSQRVIPHQHSLPCLPLHSPLIKGSESG